MESLTNFDLKLRNDINHDKYINYHDILYLYDKYDIDYHINFINSIIHKYDKFEEIDDYLHNHKPKKLKKNKIISL